MDKPFKVRFAPSPTGPFHIGGARSALFNWLLARHEKGCFLLRVEDTDLKRSSRESEDNIKQSLRWLGLDWDEGVDEGGPNGPYRQTERTAIYQKEAERLLEEDKAYRCYCTEEELEESRKRQLAEGKTPIYDGRCAHLSMNERVALEAEGRKSSLRLRVPPQGVFAFDDMVRGHVEFQAAGVGDFIIVKSDGLPVYNFGVVVDDALMGVTHVVRAEEHLSNTPRQLAIYRALGYEIPRFGHISLILGADGKKMSKRHGATSVEQYKNMGYLPEAVVNYLALLGWSPKGERELFSREELVEQFSMDRVSSNDAVFDIEKLNWINFQYMKQLSPEELFHVALPFLEQAGYAEKNMTDEKKDWMTRVIWYVRDRLYYGQQVTEHVRPFFEETGTLTEEAELILRTGTSKVILDCFAEKLATLSACTEEAVKEAFSDSMKATGIKGKAAFEPVRIALTGEPNGPGLYAMIALFGREKTLKRLKQAIR